MLTLGTDAETITGTLRRGLLRILGPRDGRRRRTKSNGWSRSLHCSPAAAIVSMLTLTLNLWLAGKIAATSGRLHRPWPDLKTAELPPMTLVVLSVALAFCFIGGMVALFAQIATTALMMAYAFTGFAVLHTLTLAHEGPRDLAVLHLRHRRGVRLAGAGDGGARPRRCRIRISRALFARKQPPPLPAS